MNNTILVRLLMVAALACSFVPQPLVAQVCDEEQAMADDYKMAIGELVQRVKKESLPEFERAYHQKNGVTKLTLWLNMLDGLESCLANAAQETTATKEQSDRYKAKLEAATKLKDRVQHDRDDLKAAAAPKDAKALMEKIDYAGG